MMFAGRPELKREISRTLKGLAFASPWIIGFLVFSAGPMAASFYFSLTRYSVLTPPEFVGFRNYTRLFEDHLFWTSLGNTAYFAFFSNIIGLTLALLLAMLLNMNVRGLALYRTVYYIPVVVPVVASSVIWLWLFNPQYGLLNYILEPLGIRPIPWLTDPKWAKPSLILMSLWSIGNTVVIFLAGLQDVPEELYEAAELDGANALRKVLHITLPMISPVIFFTLVMGIIGGLQVFTQSYIMTGGGPADSTLFYALYLYQNAFRYFKMGYAAAQSWLLFILIVALSISVFRSSSYWVHYAGE